MLAHYEQSHGFDQISHALSNIHGLYGCSCNLLDVISVYSLNPGKLPGRFSYEWPGYEANVHYQPLAQKCSILVASFPGHPGLQLFWNGHLYIFSHMRVGKRVLVGNENLEEGAGDALWLE